MLFAAFVLFEIQTALRKRTTTMDHASHFGGMFVGISTAGYMRATGFHEKKLALQSQDSVQARAHVDSKTVDIGAIAVQELKEVKESVTNAANK